MKIFTFLLITFITTLSSFAADEKSADKNSGEFPRKGEGEAFAVYFENDSRGLGGPGSDQEYTNGFRFSYIYAQDKVPKWAHSYIEKLKVLDHTPDQAKLNLAISLGHQIYTPNDIVEKKLIINDRPYAANFREETVANFLELDLGVVGPSALGEQVQNNVHDWIGKYHAAGWEHSLHDEPTVQFLYQKRLKVNKSETFDSITYYGVGLGNILVGAHFGGMVRFGLNLPDDFGPTRPSASDGDSFVTPVDTETVSKKSLYVFAGARANAVARSIFLDGNSFRDSHRVRRYPFNFDTEFGAGAQVMPFAVVWRFVTRSPEFEERSKAISFASLNLVYFL